MEEEEEEEWSDWFVGSKKFRNDGSEKVEGVEPVGVVLENVGVALGSLGRDVFSFFGSISLLTQDLIFSLSLL